jgi:hypothetical protein
MPRKARRSPDPLHELVASFSDEERESHIQASGALADTLLRDLDAYVMDTPGTSYAVVLEALRCVMRTVLQDLHEIEPAPSDG